MAFYDTEWYVNSVGWTAVTAWATGATIAAGALRRQLAAPTVGNERVFVCIVAGTTHATTEPTWVITRGAKTTDNTVTWQECTGAAPVNGDAAGAATWAVAKAAGTPTLGAIIQRNSGASFQICSTAGTLSASEPAFSNTAGVTTADGTTTWTCLGASFAAWSAPHARLANAIVATWGAIGHDFWCADNHTETSAAAFNLTLGTQASPCRFFSIDHTLSLPATAASLKAGATISNSTASVNAIQVGTTGGNYFYGFTFIATGALTNALIGICNGFAQGKFESCSFQLGAGTISGSTISVGNGSGGNSIIELVNCTFSFANSGQAIVLGGGYITWRNTAGSSLLGTIPTALFKGTATDPSNVLIEGVDLSAIGANTLFGAVIYGYFATLKTCKLGSGAICATITLPLGAVSNVDLINCDSGTVISRNERHNFNGDLTTSSTYYRTGGATDGVTPVSHQVITTIYANPWRPFLMLPMVIWNDVIGATRTVTLYGILQTAGRLPYNDEFWFDVEYMGSTTSPLASVASCSKATLLTTHTQVAVADAVSVWNGSPTSPTPFSLAVTFTAQQKGYLTIYPKIGAPSLTFLIDPRPVLT